MMNGKKSKIILKTKKIRTDFKCDFRFELFHLLNFFGAVPSGQLANIRLPSFIWTKSRYCLSSAVVTFDFVFNMKDSDWFASSLAVGSDCCCCCCWCVADWLLLVPFTLSLVPFVPTVLPAAVDFLLWILSFLYPMVPMMMMMMVMMTIEPLHLKWEDSSIPDSMNLCLCWMFEHFHQLILIFRFFFA